MIRMLDNAIETSNAAQRLLENGHKVEFPSPYAPMSKTLDERRQRKVGGGAQ